MISIITGDIINSRKLLNPGDWLSQLKKILSTYGKSPKAWDIYRGDSFQIEIKEAAASFLVALKIKSTIKCFKGLDVRMAIGIGEKTFNAQSITESNGSAFINSGEMFEDLTKNRQTLAIKSPWPIIDEELNLMIRLASIAIDKWTPSSAELIKLSLQLDTSSQKELSRKLKIAQSSISERLSRAHYKEIIDVEKFFRLKIKQQIG